MWGTIEIGGLTLYWPYYCNEKTKMMYNQRYIRKKSTVYGITAHAERASALYTEVQWLVYRPPSSAGISTLQCMLEFENAIEDIGTVSPQTLYIVSLCPDCCTFVPFSLNYILERNLSFSSIYSIITHFESIESRYL